MPATGLSAPLESSGGLLVGADRRILLGLRAAWKRVAPNLWDAIGGRIEPGESRENALVRELREEIGVEVLDYRWIASIPEPRPDLYGPSLHHIFAVHEWKGEPRIMCDENTELRWFTAAELAQLPNVTQLDLPRLFDLALASAPAGGS